jgi:hypothetical protein
MRRVYWETEDLQPVGRITVGRNPANRRGQPKFKRIGVSVPSLIEFKKTPTDDVSISRDGAGAILEFPATPSDIVSAATPAKRKRGKSLSRRTGQDGHIEKSGRWFVVRYWKDIAGQEKREHMRERICPISGPGLLSKSERKRKAREIIRASGADSPEYFHEVVKPNPVGITFREQSELWLEQLQNRKRNPIGESYAVTIQGALDKWILPAIGDLPVANVDNLSVKPLIEEMCKSKLSPRTVNKYVEHIKQVVESLRGPNGEPIHRRKWDPETMDLPIVEHAAQNRPSSYDSRKPSELVSDSFCRRRKMALLSRLSRNRSKKMQKKLQRKCRRMLVVH